MKRFSRWVMPQVIRVSELNHIGFQPANIIHVAWFVTTSGKRISGKPERRAYALRLDDGILERGRIRKSPIAGPGQIIS
jgi:hypothetical protein